MSGSDPTIGSDPTMAEYLSGSDPDKTDSTMSGSDPDKDSGKDAAGTELLSITKIKQPEEIVI